jgi:hypothetical protein
VEDKDGNIVWREDVTSADDEDLKEGERYLGEAVVVFHGSRNEKLGEKQNLYGKGAILAKVIVYGPNGSNDIKEYSGYTMSSDPEKFGVLKSGEYTVNRLKPGERKGPYGSDWVIESRTTKLPAMNDYNPAHPERNPGYLLGVFIHRSNLDGWAGTFSKNGKTRGVSEGCLLIAPKDWLPFNRQLSIVKHFKLILKRD